MQIIYCLDSKIVFEPMKNRIGEIVKFHRKQARLSQHQLADLSGVGKTSVFDIEHGKTTVRWSTLQRVLGALNIQIEFTKNGHDDEPPY